MLKKSDVLPSILALISTAIVVVLGFVWFNKIEAKNSSNYQNVTTKNTKTDAVESPVLNPTPKAIKTNSSTFAPPSIVPQGTSVRINGSTRMIRINQALKKSFQRRFPGTAIITNADGGETGVDLLLTGEIDIAAILRPLTNEEKAQGLAVVTVDESMVNVEDKLIPQVHYYAYREPADIEVEAFLGFALSPQGQKAIVNR